METTGRVDLDEIISTGLLHDRPRRPADVHRENAATLQLADGLARSPETIFRQLADAILELCRAQSAGISLLDDTKAHFFWPAVAGRWTQHAGEGTPRDFGPCGTVLDRNDTLLFVRPERHFTYLAEAEPAIAEGLLAPFRINGKPMGTVWAILHDAERRFDLEDARVLENLSRFTATAYSTLRATGALARRH